MFSTGHIYIWLLKYHYKLRRTYGGVWWFRKGRMVGETFGIIRKYYIG